MVQNIEYNYNQIWYGIKANKIHICKLQLYTSGGTSEDDEALILLPRLHELEGCPFASISVSIGSPCA